jgi:hypothetical protein
LARIYYDGIKPLVATRKLIAGGAIFEEQTALKQGNFALFRLFLEYGTSRDELSSGD